MSLWRHRRRFQCSDFLSVPAIGAFEPPARVLSVMSTVLTETSGSVYAVIALFSPAFSAVCTAFFLASSCILKYFGMAKATSMVRTTRTAIISMSVNPLCFLRFITFNTSPFPGCRRGFSQRRSEKNVAFMILNWNLNGESKDEKRINQYGVCMVFSPCSVRRLSDLPLILLS